MKKAEIQQDAMRELIKEREEVQLQMIEWARDGIPLIPKLQDVLNSLVKANNDFYAVYCEQKAVLELSLLRAGPEGSVVLRFFEDRMQHILLSGRQNIANAKVMLNDAVQRGPYLVDRLKRLNAAISTGDLTIAIDPAGQHVDARAAA